jgi:ADP-ribose diphosphatase
MITPSKLQKWQLLKTEDISIDKFMPVEKRSYKMPNGKIIDNFYIFSLEDSVHVAPVLADGKFVMVRLYKQGTDRVVTQFPAGRFETGKHKDMADVAIQELEEEAGIKASHDQLKFVGKHSLQSTKSTEYAHLFLIQNVTFNSDQKLDETEEIEIITVTPQKIDQMIENGDIIGSPTIANWYLLKTKYPQLTK